MAHLAGDHPTIAGYQLLRELGRGGMGVVYLAQQVSLNRQVAVKVLIAGSLDDSAALRRLRKEAQLLRELAHPNVVKLLDVDVSTSTPYLVFEYIPGDASLESLIASGGKSVPETVPLMVAMLRAMEFVHRRGVLHRDLKPANVLLGPEGQPRLIDFGLARGISPDETRQTQAGHVVGTLSYMAPEQMDGKDATQASDVYAWALISYELLARRFVFSVHASAPQVTATQRYTKPIPSLRLLAPDVPERIASCVMSSLARDPADRPTIDQLLRALDGDADIQFEGARPQTSAPASRRLTDRTRSVSPPFASASERSTLQEAPSLTARAASRFKSLGLLLALPASALVAFAGLRLARYRGGGPDAGVQRGSLAQPLTKEAASLDAQDVRFEVRGRDLVARISSQQSTFGVLAWSDSTGPHEQPIVAGKEHLLTVGGPTIAGVESLDVKLEGIGSIGLLKAFEPEVIELNRRLNALDARELLARADRSDSSRASGRNAARLEATPDSEWADRVARDGPLVRMWLRRESRSSLRDSVLQKAYDLETLQSYGERTGHRASISGTALLPLDFSEHVYRATKEDSPVRREMAAGTERLEGQALVDGVARDVGGRWWRSASYGIYCDIAKEFAYRPAHAIDDVLGVQPTQIESEPLTCAVSLQVPPEAYSSSIKAVLGVCCSDPGASVLWIEINGHLRIPFCQICLDGSEISKGNADHAREIPRDVLKPGRNEFRFSFASYPGKEKTSAVYVGALFLELALQATPAGTSRAPVAGGN